MANLYEIPTLPDEIKDAALDNRLVLFVGAGASRLLDCPSWEGMADSVLNAQCMYVCMYTCHISCFVSHHMTLAYLSVFMIV